jgi:DNA-binding MarR family transcriptional regulator
MSIATISTLVMDPLPFLIADAARQFRAAFDRDVRALGITGQQWRVLAMIARNPGIQQAAAAEQMEVEPITLSRMVDRLEQSGLAERRPVAGDRRARALHLTPAATPLVEQLRERATMLADSALACFDAAERDQLICFMERFRANLTSHAAAMEVAA